MREFEKDYNKLVEILQDSNVTENGKEKVYDNFCRKYPFFDTSKLDRYFI